jgi:hypothetical protein
VKDHENDENGWVYVVLVLLVAAAGFGCGFGGGGDTTRDAIASDLAEQGYALQRVETVGGESRWMVVEQ